MLFLIASSISLLFLISGFIVFLFGIHYTKKNNNPTIPISNDHPRFAILIPARDESRVISGLLESIAGQTRSVSMQDVYVIVEQESDPTIAIAKKYQAQVIVRRHLDQKGKGYALQEALTAIFANHQNYDAYFIFDADNILDKNFIMEMEKTYRQGYDIGIGYRNCKNGNSNWIASCSTLTFSLLNTIMNRKRIKYQANVIISGTGYFIKGDIVSKWQGFPFHTLTEDYELTLYSILNGYKTYYNEEACYYDEQPTTYHQSRVQRTRWIRGYFDARKIYVPQIRHSIHQNDRNIGSKKAEVLGVIPYILMVIGLILWLLINVIEVFVNPSTQLKWLFVINLIGMCLFAYVILYLVTLVIIIKEKKLNLKDYAKWKALLLHPFFLVTYISCAIRALFMKERVWEKIEHKEVEIK